MSMRPPRTCSAMGCPGLAFRGPYCPKCESKHNYRGGKRLSPTKRGYDARWRRLRKAKLSRDPWCQKCEAAAAVLVHHVDGVSNNQTIVPMDRLQSLCQQCHSRMEGGWR